ncbi:hypothetical protein BDB00DRAFT_732649, partial [Zychaea mexicana]|uniref:uncharacterized protein n=1 Tax=Zychaea mexicana TaxID=64656 RepID=UPI0022FE25FF
VPGFIPSSICLLCNSELDTIPHFLITCPPRWRVWTQVWSVVVYAEPTVLGLSQFITELNWSLAPPSTLPHYISAVQSTLLALWRAYWRLVFDRIPFDPTIVVQSV